METRYRSLPIKGLCLSLRRDRAATVGSSMTRTALRVGIIDLDLVRVCRGDTFMTKRGKAGDLDLIYSILSRN